MSRDNDAPDRWRVATATSIMRPTLGGAHGRSMRLAATTIAPAVAANPPSDRRLDEHRQPTAEPRAEAS